MKINLLALTVVAALASTTGVANAKGCLKGAAVGGVDGFGGLPASRVPSGSVGSTADRVAPGPR